MKQLSIVLLLLVITFSLWGQGTPKQSKIGIRKGHAVLLVYTGTMAGMNVDMGIHIEMDSTIGIRYEVTMERGTSVISHTALFYEFATPDSTVFYNFNTHRASVNYRKASSGGEPNVKVVGTETVDSFTCTHLQHSTENPHAVVDYWMSTQVPGFSKIITAIKSANPGLFPMALSGTLFTWGGLVRMKSAFTNSKTGQTLSMDLNLIEANTSMNFPASDFRVPAQ